MSENLVKESDAALENLGNPSVVKEDPLSTQIQSYLRMDRIPHIWCAGCGIGTAVNIFIRALIDSKIDKNTISVVSGIGCSGRVAGYLNLDSFHTTHGRAIPFAVGLKMANPKQQVVVISGDGDLSAIGGNHLLHAARRNFDIKVVCINNFVYSMTGGQAAPTTPKGTIASTTPYGFFLEQFNLSHLVDTFGATFVSRWTTFHAKSLQKTFVKMMNKKGFSFVEVLSPCPTLYGRRNHYRTGLEEMKMFKENCKVKHDIDTREATLIPGQEIIVGNFVNRDQPTFLEAMEAQMQHALGEEYIPYQGAIT